jgi:stage II sporulation protein D
MLHSQQYDIKTDADVLIFDGKTTKKARIGSQNIITAQGIRTINPNKKHLISLDATGRQTTISISPSLYTITGKGWGHAVGMSQDGAHGMGLAGYTYKDILQHYFPGTTIE